MEIDKLKEYYKDALVTSSSPEQKQDYIWYLTDTSEKIGIHKHALTDKDIQLLSLFLTPWNKKNVEMKYEQQIWFDFLYEGIEKPISIDIPIRFIHFLIKKGQFEHQDFQDALHALFPTDILIIWKNEHEGTVIEKNRDISYEMINFNEIVDTLSSDFYLNIYLFIGQTNMTSAPDLREHFLWEEGIFHKGQQMIQNKKVYHIQDVLPYVFLEEISPQTRNRSVNSILHSIEEDHELMKSIKIFIECNLNVSSAAKKLYMHRNSLQYRIDKFIEKTGIDIKNFKEAMIVYLIILGFEYF